MHKKGAIDKFENYKGITLLSPASKLYTNILTNKLVRLTKNKCSRNNLVLERTEATQISGLQFNEIGNIGELN
jgi:hypothetical protein